MYALLKAKTFRLKCFKIDVYCLATRRISRSNFIYIILFFISVPLFICAVSIQIKSRSLYRQLAIFSIGTRGLSKHSKRVTAIERLGNFRKWVGLGGCALTRRNVTATGVCLRRLIVDATSSLTATNFTRHLPEISLALSIKYDVCSIHFARDSRSIGQKYHRKLFDEFTPASAL